MQASGNPQVITTGAEADDIGQPTAWSACRDPERHPVTKKRCDASFLDCFHCGNCVITADHLPQLLGLVDALAVRRSQLGELDWWQRYGPAWAAIRHDVMSKFSPAALAHAETVKTDDAMLDLVEHPWKKP